MDFEQLLKAMEQQKPSPHRLQSILCFDPGHTTGWAYFTGGELIEQGEIGTHSIQECLETAQPLFHTYVPDIVVMEDYRVYKWKKDQHVGSEMLTTRIIGSLETLAIQDFVGGIVKQPAHIAKNFCTDAKLKDWGYYLQGKRHARDAIRHGCYYILFGAVRPEDQIG